MGKTWTSPLAEVKFCVSTEEMLWQYYGRERERSRERERERAREDSGEVYEESYVRRVL